MLDFIGISILIIGFIRGYMKGVLVAAFSIVGVVLGVMIALKLSGWLGYWLLEKGWVTSGWGQLISYVILFLGVVLLVRFIAKAVESGLQLAMLGWVNRIAGGVIYVLLAALIWSSFLWLLDQMHVLKSEAIARSKTFGWFQPIAPWVYAHIGSVLPFARDIFQDLGVLFDKIDKTIPSDVGTHR